MNLEWFLILGFMGIMFFLLAGILIWYLRDIRDSVFGSRKDMGENIVDVKDKMSQSLSRLQERLVQVSAQQENLNGLGLNMKKLIDVLSNNSARGNFCEMQLETLVKKILPRSAYSFQKTLSNGKRPDCLLTLPKPLGNIAVDAKFPLEDYRALVEGDFKNKYMCERFSNTVSRLLKDISEKYIIPNETGEFALLFLPSEAMHAHLHSIENNKIFDIAHKYKVWIVSPVSFASMLNLIVSVLRDMHLENNNKEIIKEISNMSYLAEQMVICAEKSQKQLNNALSGMGEISRDAHRVRDSIKSIKEIGKSNELPKEQVQEAELERL